MALAGQDEAREAIFTAVKEICEASKDYTGTTASGMVRDAAYAWRALSGGQQPGGIFIDVKS